MSDEKYKAPRLPGGQPTTFSRTPILNGKTWTMFMPGQSSGSRSEPPKVWPEAGALLRVPKCVFLSSVPPARLYADNLTLMTKWEPFGYFGHFDDPVTRDVRTDQPAPAQPYGSLVFDGFAGVYGYIGWSPDPRYADYHPDWEGKRKWRKQSVFADPLPAEHTRLVAEYRKAKQVLEAKYPTRVFVQICEFFPSDPAMKVLPPELDENRPRVLDCVTPEGIAANTPKRYLSGPDWCCGPSPRDVGWDQQKGVPRTDFFGTDFLHIHCGYQSCDGTYIPGVGYQDRGGPDLSDLTLRKHWKRFLQFGYPLEDVRGFPGLGYPQWFADPDDGYEGSSYDWTRSFQGSCLNDVGTVDGHPQPLGKAAAVRATRGNFAGYRTVLHEFDAPWGVGAMPTLNQHLQATRFPPHVTAYDDQDWVEQTIIGPIPYSVRQGLEPDIDPYGNNYFPGYDFDNAVYNLYVQYPGSNVYVTQWVPQIQREWQLMRAAVLGLGPKTVTLWKSLIAGGLGDLGFEYGGGSTGVTADSIVALVEEHYGLTTA